MAQICPESRLPAEVATRRAGQPLPSGSSVLTLRTDFDQDGLLRVAGCLQELDRPKELKHPILLRNDHVFTRLLISTSHICLLYAGVQVTLLDL